MRGLRARGSAFADEPEADGVWVLRLFRGGSVHAPFWIGLAAAVMGLGALALALAAFQYGSAKDRAVNELRARAVLASTVFDTYFAGQIGTLSSMALAPVIRTGDVSGMSRYFQQVRAANPAAFTNGIAWIDRTGTPRAWSEDSVTPALRVADRSFFRRALSTGKPFVSEGIVSRSNGRRVIAIAVPTRDEAGEISGVLTGGVRLQQSQNPDRAEALGFTGLMILDRKRQDITREDLAIPANDDLLRQVRRSNEGVLSDTRGAENAPGHVVVFATTKAAGWKILLDRPRSELFASARRGLLVAVVPASTGMVLALLLIGWAARRAQRESSIQQAVVSRWTHVTNALGQATSPDEASDVLVRALANAFPDAFVYVGVRDGPRGRMRIHGRRARSPAPFTTSDPALASLLPDLALEVEGVIASSPADLAARLPDHAAALQPRAQALLSTPIRSRDGEPLGVAALLWPSAQPLSRPALEEVQALASQAADALQRTQLQQLDRHTATALQESLLPYLSDEVPGATVAARYRAGAEGLLVGGDWYDIVQRPDGLIHVTVGDVAGRGIHAATLMAELRLAFRAYALDHDDPAVILKKINRHVPTDGMATAAILTFDPYTLTARAASAGHPPLLLHRPDADRVDQVVGVAMPPLGWIDDSAGEAAEEISIPENGHLLLYSDGLIERRGSNLDRGIAAVTHALLQSNNNPTTAGVLADAVLAATGSETADDDTALLVLAFTSPPARLRIRIPADTAHLRHVRRRVGRWLHLLGRTPAERADAVIVLHEAAANAIEHACHNDPDRSIVLTVDVTPTGLTIGVRDDGTWSESTPTPERGRGLHIIRTISTTLQVQPTSTGTQLTAVLGE